MGGVPSPAVSPIRPEGQTVASPRGCEIPLKCLNILSFWVPKASPPIGERASSLLRLSGKTGGPSPQIPARAPGVLGQQGEIQVSSNELLTSLEIAGSQTNPKHKDSSTRREKQPCVHLCVYVCVCGFEVTTQMGRNRPRKPKGPPAMVLMVCEVTKAGEVRCPLRVSVFV